MDSPPPQPLDRRRNWLDLPPDVTAAILSRVGAAEILNSVQRVCSLWRNICKDPSMWRSIDMHNLGDRWRMDFDLETMCRHAADRSSGGLVDINIEYFGSDDLLMYVANRSSHLKRLLLVSCHSISDEGLSEAAPRFPLLEDLEISNCSFSNDAIAVVGRSCPLLKSFKLNRQRFKQPHIECDEEAIAIAENMPGLRHLQIFGNKLTNDGLWLILDKCLHLESLDMRQCFNINLEENLEKKCAERMKKLRRPYDSTDDYPFKPEIPDIGSSEEDHPSGILDVDFLSDDINYYYEFSGGSDYYYEFSGGSDFSDYADLYFD